jgi:tRNA threonylcarbamoyladenosine biosynthesis protein TsaB
MPSGAGPERARPACYTGSAMRILALETATLAGGAALLDGDLVIAESRSNIALTHSERVMAAVDHVLRDARWTVDDLDGLAVSIGPGSFTGLRVGLATIKGLAFARALPVAGVPTLDALAATLPFADAPVVPLLDARKNEVYLSRYRWDGRAMVREWGYLALPPDAAVARLTPPVIVLGDGVAPCRPHLAALGEGARVAPPAQRLPSPAVVAQLGHAILAAGGGVSADEVTALYLRPSEAELKRAAAAGLGAAHA